MSSDHPTHQQQQPVSFLTSTPYPLPSSKFMIPTAWKRYQLSQLVNKALELDKTRPVPFDFLVRGELLRGSLEEWCRERGVGEEETLEIEYIESVMPPQKMSDFPHEDWVSGVSCYIPGYFLTSSYDGHLRAFDYAHNLVLARRLHAPGAPMSALCVVPFAADGGVRAEEQGEGEGERYTIATAGHDGCAQVVSVVLPSPSSSAGTKAGAKSKSKTTPLAALHLHTAPLASIASNSTGTRLLSAGWDGLVGVWVWDGRRVDVDEVALPAGSSALGDSVRERKRRRVGGGAEGEEEGKGGAGERARRKAPASVLKSHVGRVSKAVFLDVGAEGGGGGERKAVSCGFDSTVRVWDVEYGVCESTISASEKPFLDLTTLGASSSVSPSSVLATSTDRTMGLYDLRLPSSSSSTSLTSSATTTFQHPATPSCVAASPSSGYQAVTGAYDGVVRVWDVRSAKGAVAAFTVGGGKKVLGVDWRRGVVGVGGEGGVEVWRVGEEGVERVVG